ncbi:hypothetical protein BaOVIS_006890 [Babesia ovis]|uniref:Uncharacterized protein n=1 Tax=Babesia ovis TaxID=5869 RepID=A0A9W5T9E9_BABOV|nr:hypothetical protein BaOVIS_006890 [Babesia ovis]
MHHPFGRNPDHVRHGLQGAPVHLRDLTEDRLRAQYGGGRGASPRHHIEDHHPLGSPRCNGVAKSRQTLAPRHQDDRDVHFHSRYHNDVRYPHLEMQKHVNDYADYGRKLVRRGHSPSHGINVQRSTQCTTYRDASPQHPDLEELAFLKAKASKLRRHLSVVQRQAEAIAPVLSKESNAAAIKSSHPGHKDYKPPPAETTNSTTSECDGALEPWKEAAAHLCSGVGSMVLAVCQLVSITGKTALSSCSNLRTVQDEDSSRHARSSQEQPRQYYKSHDRTRSIERYHSNVSHPVDRYPPSFMDTLQWEQSNISPRHKESRVLRDRRTQNSALRRMLSRFTDSSSEIDSVVTRNPSYDFHDEGTFGSDTDESVVLYMDDELNPPQHDIYDSSPYVNGGTPNRNQMPVGPINYKSGLQHGWPSAHNNQRQGDQPVLRINLGDLEASLPTISKSPALEPNVVSSNRAGFRAFVPNSNPSYQISPVATRTAGSLPEPQIAPRGTTINASPTTATMDPSPSMSIRRDLDGLRDRICAPHQDQGTHHKVPSDGGLPTTGGLTVPGKTSSGDSLSTGGHHDATLPVAVSLNPGMASGANRKDDGNYMDGTPTKYISPSSQVAGPVDDNVESPETKESRSYVEEGLKPKTPRKLSFINKWKLRKAGSNNMKVPLL